jgi:predicted DNA-binding ribbon-helix-helix protein
MHTATLKSAVVKRSIVVAGHKTSISLEDAFWSDLKEIAYRQQATVSKLVKQIDETRQQSNLLGNPLIRTRTYPHAWEK